MNNALVTALAGSLARWVITMAAAQGVAVSDDLATQIASGALAAAMLIWSLVHKKQTDTAIKDAKAGV